MKTRLSICRKKARYTSAAEATTAATRADFPLHPYHCDRCDQFHLETRLHFEGLHFLLRREYWRRRWSKFQLWILRPTARALRSDCGSRMFGRRVFGGVQCRHGNQCTGESRGISGERQWRHEAKTLHVELNLRNMRNGNREVPDAIFKKAGRLGMGDANE